MDELSEPRSSTCNDLGDVTREPVTSLLSLVERRRCGCASTDAGDGLDRAKLTAVMPRRGCRLLVDSDVSDDDVSRCCVELFPALLIDNVSSFTALLLCVVT